MTTATWTPARTTSAICRAMAGHDVGVDAEPPPPPNASPESLSSTRRVAGRGTPRPTLARCRPRSARSPIDGAVCHRRRGALRDGCARRCRARRRPAPVERPSACADLEAGEAGRRSTPASSSRPCTRLLGVLHRRLLEQHDVLEEAVDPTLDDLGQRRLGLALLAGGRLGDAPLGLDDVGRDLVAGDVRAGAWRRSAWPRRGRPRRRRPSNATSTPTCGGRSGGLAVQVDRDRAVEHGDAA